MLRAIADVADAAGAANVWIASHLFHREPIACAAVTLAASRNIGIVLMAMSPYTVHPMLRHHGRRHARRIFSRPGATLLRRGRSARPRSGRDHRRASAADLARDDRGRARAARRRDHRFRRPALQDFRPPPRDGRPSRSDLACRLRSAHAGTGRRKGRRRADQRRHVTGFHPLVAGQRAARRGTWRPERAEGGARLLFGRSRRANRP